ncbi:ead/Ea22-like family protein [Cronobacter dublinensis]|nr:ead/Ea22-like family protein [Cronobacter dublinensis]ELY5818836.1 ead/Ea22-like family protein [Cronobacter dublinensis]
MTDTAKLKAAAEKARWGDWSAYKPHSGARGYEVRVGSEAVAQHCLKDDAAFIAAASPKAVLCLIAALEAAQPQTAAALDVLAERQRQVTQEGWTPANDDDHTDGSLAAAAGSYALHAAASAWGGVSYALPASWPWSVTWWKPKNPRADLVRAAALIIAEIERIDRAAGINLDTGGEA